jgi:hypothetical protein
VIEDDEQDGDRSQAFYVRPKGSVQRCSARVLFPAEMPFVDF